MKYRRNELGISLLGTDAAPNSGCRPAIAPVCSPTRARSGSRWAWLFFATAALLAFGAQAEIGTVKNVSGEVQVEREGHLLPVTPGFELSQDDAIITGPDGRVGIIFIDNSRFSAGPNSRLELARFRFNTTTHEGEFVTRVRRGTVAVVSGQIAKHTEDAMKIETPQANLGVRGTKFLVQVAE